MKRRVYRYIYKQLKKLPPLEPGNWLCISISIVTLVLTVGLIFMNSIKFAFIDFTGKQYDFEADELILRIIRSVSLVIYFIELFLSLNTG